MSDLTIPEDFAEWASDDSYDGGSDPTKIALSATDAAQGFVPEVASVSAQEANWFFQRLARGVLSTRDELLLPRDSRVIQVATATVYPLLVGCGGGLMYSGDGFDGAIEVFDRLWVYSPSYGSGYVPVQVNDQWAIELYMSGGYLRAGVVNGELAPFWTDADGSLVTSNSVHAYAGTPDADDMRSAQDGDAGVFIAIDLGGTDVIFHTYQTATPTTWAVSMGTAPAALGGTVWENNGRMAYHNGTLVLIGWEPASGPDMGHFAVNTTTSAMTSWSGWSEIPGLAEPDVYKCLYVGYSEALGGWIMINDWGNVYKCADGDNPAVGTNWVKQNTGDHDALAISGMAALSAVVVGDVILMTAADTSGTVFELYITRDYWATASRHPGPSHVVDCGEHLGYYLPAAIPRIAFSGRIRNANVLDFD